MMLVATSHRRGNAGCDSAIGSAPRLGVSAHFHGPAYTGPVSKARKADSDFTKNRFCACAYARRRTLFFFPTKMDKIRRAGCGTIDLAFELFAEDVGLASEDQLRSQNSTIYPHREQHLVAVLEKSIAEPLSRARGDARRQALLPDHMSGEEVPSARQQFEGGDRADAFQGARISDGRARPARHVLQCESSRGLRKLSARAVRVLVAARGAAQPGARRHRHDLRESDGAVVILVENRLRISRAFTVSTTRCSDKL
ncbi:unnamed protein product [Trichogramma brassicae]|uniref:Uncharacterized protein n=1 Tax=Trichogramma brassicae TaxID=86971 RepID=A0A6H5IG89_9HYME|nr:unnamed protein product [Trichogramma brassicae]